MQAQDSTDNSIFNDYLSHIKSIDDAAESYLNTPIDKWSWHAALRFNSILRESFPDMEGGYVSNPRGGFLGCWWNGIKIKDLMTVYLQIETQFNPKTTSNLCFKVSVYFIPYKRLHLLISVFLYLSKIDEGNLALIITINRL